MGGLNIGLVALVLLCFQIAELGVHQFFEGYFLVINLFVDFETFTALSDSFVQFFFKLLVGLDALLDFSRFIEGMGISEHYFFDGDVGSVEILLSPF